MWEDTHRCTVQRCVADCSEHVSLHVPCEKGDECKHKKCPFGHPNEAGSFTNRLHVRTQNSDAPAAQPGPSAVRHAVDSKQDVPILDSQAEKTQNREKTQKLKTAFPTRSEASPSDSERRNQWTISKTTNNKWTIDETLEVHSFWDKKSFETLLQNGCETLDVKFPLFTPSYGRPNTARLNLDDAMSDLSARKTYLQCVFVEKSQRDDYLERWNSHVNITFVVMSKNKYSGCIGDTRFMMLEFAKLHGVKNYFSMDDLIFQFVGLTLPADPNPLFENMPGEAMRHDPRLVTKNDAKPQQHDISLWSVLAHLQHPDFKEDKDKFAMVGLCRLPDFVKSRRAHAFRTVFGCVSLINVPKITHLEVLLLCHIFVFSLPFLMCLCLVLSSY